MFKKIALIFLSLIFTFSANLQAAENKTTNNTDRTKLVMGTSPDYPVFEYMKNGEIVGFDIDLARAIAKEMDAELVIKGMDFASLIPAVQAGKVDFAMSGFAKEEKRLNFVDFSDEYFKENFAIVSKAKSKINSPAELDGKKVMVQTGTTYEKFVKELQKKYKRINLHSIENNFNAVEDLKIGRVDAVIIGEIQAKQFTNASDKLHYTVLPNENQGGMAAILKKNSKLTSKFNEALASLKESGKLEELKQKWFD